MGLVILLRYNAMCSGERVQKGTGKRKLHPRAGNEGQEEK
jgi:hypothetical protein